MIGGRVWISRGDAQAAQHRLDWIAQLSRIGIDDQSRELAKRLVSAGLVPPRELEDALHIALVSLHGFDYLASWNFAHFVRAETKYRLFTALRDWGLHATLLSPPKN